MTQLNCNETPSSQVWSMYFDERITDNQLDNALRLVTPWHWYICEATLIDSSFEDEYAIDLLDQCVGYV